MIGSDPTTTSVSGAVTQIDLRRLGPGDLVAGITTLVLFVSLFLPWYSLGTPADSPPTRSIGALSDPAGGFRYLLLLGALAVLGYLTARTALPPGTRMPLPHGQLLVALCGVNGALVLFACMVLPPTVQFGTSASAGLGFGSVIGVLAATVAAMSAWSARRDVDRLWSAPQAPEIPAGERVGAAPERQRDATRSRAKTGAAAGTGTGILAAAGTGTVPGAAIRAASRPLATGTAASEPSRCGSCGVAKQGQERFCLNCGAATTSRVDS